VSESEADEGAVESTQRPDVDVGTVVTYVQWGALLALGILAVVAGIGLYGSLSSIIDVWIAERYQPIASAAFNFAVLSVAAGGMFGLVRRL